MKKQPVKSLFFDLDGTLLDTAPDLVAALNHVLQRHGQPTLPLNTVRPTIADGSRGILTCGFPLGEQHPEFNTLKKEFLHAYQQCLTDQTHYFEGMESVLDHLDKINLPWGIVTNKPAYLAEPLLAHFKLDRRYRCLVAGDTLEKRKPDPDPLLHACQLARVNPHHSLYIGDAKSDVIAAHAAGMRAIIAQYGYLDHNSQPHLWQAEGMIQTPLEIINLLEY